MAAAACSAESICAEDADKGAVSMAAEEFAKHSKNKKTKSHIEDFKKYFQPTESEIETINNEAQQSAFYNLSEDMMLTRLANEACSSEVHYEPEYKLPGQVYHCWYPPRGEVEANTFWHFVYDSRVRVVVMLSRFKAMKNGCDEFYLLPADATEPVSWNLISLKIHKVGKQGVKELKLYKMGGKKRLEVDVVYIEIKDDDIFNNPKNPEKFGKFYNLLRRYFPANPGHLQPAVALLSSNGFYRTGVVAAIDIIIRFFENNMSVSFNSIIANIRFNRIAAFMNSDEYVLFHRFVAHYISENQLGREVRPGGFCGIKR